MDIVQLSYFIAVVNCDFNLSEASNKIHRTQSALSQFISNYEKRENITLFLRKSNRLVGLTKSGEIIYKYALDIVKIYEEMTIKAIEAASVSKQVIKIGVPSLILMVYFSSMLPKFKEKYPTIEFKVVEAGSYQIRQLLIKGEIDIGIILGPTELKNDMFHQVLVHSSDVVAFIDQEHPLATENKIEWNSILNYDIATFNSDHSIYNLLNKKIKTLKETKQITYTANAWDYLINLTRGTNIITFLPELIYQFIPHQSIMYKKTVAPLAFDIYACMAKNRDEQNKHNIYDDILTIF